MYPIKSENDYRNYRIIELNNGIKVLLASDIKPPKHPPTQNGEINSTPKPVTTSKHDCTETEEEETRLAAAALCVSAGSFNEPSEVPGLAHFLEHMVFMGSEKYPTENDYDSYLRQHGGSDNAYTTDEATVFYFDVQPEHFDGALDRFAQFFISPLLLEDAVDREVKAVDSEFKGRIPDDDWRTDEILHSLAIKTHPYSRFSHGNKKSIATIPKEKGINVMKKLRTFFDDYYCSKQMTLALCSPQPLDELEDMAMKYFAGIPPRNPVKLLHNVVLENPYDFNEFHKVIYITPVEEIHLLKMTWIIPPQQRHYKHKPAYYIAWLIQHQCKGSIYAYLKQKGFICSIDAYCSTQCTMFSRFCLTAELTEKGLDNIAVVIHTVFQYIFMLQRNGACKDMYEEQQKISENCFKYQEPSEPSDFVEDVVENMQYYADTDYLTGSSEFAKFDPVLIEEVQNCLTLDQVNFVVLSKTYCSRCQSVEPWFKAKYTVEEIPCDWICSRKCSKVNDRLHLPSKNSYIPVQFDIHDVPSSMHWDYPVVIADGPSGKAWYKPDQKFLLPKADINFMLITPHASRSAYHLMCSGILEYTLDFELEELQFEAAVASQEIGQSGAGKCHRISLCGFSDKLMLLFKDVLSVISSFNFSQNAFDVSKEEMERDYRNSLIHSQEFNAILKQLLLCNVVANPIESLKELVDLTPEALKEYYQSYFSQIYVESLYQGNIRKEEAEEFQSHIYSSFNSKVLTLEHFPQIKTLCLPQGRSVCRHYGFNKKDPNSVIHNYYQVGPPSMRQYNIASILQLIMEESLFNILRTQQQLGYTVYCSCEYSSGGILGYSVTVETDSDKFNADDIDMKIEDFFKTFYTKLEAEEEISYEKYVNAYIKSLKQADLSVGDEASRNWSEIYHQDYIFDRRSRNIEMAKVIDKEEVLDFMKKYLMDRNNVRMVSIQIIGHPSVDDNGGETTDSDEVTDSDSDDDDSDSEEEEEVEDLRHREIKLIHVDSKQYTQSIDHVNTFRDGNCFYPVAKMSVK